MIKKLKLALATGLALCIATAGVATADTGDRKAMKEKFDTNKDGQLNDAERAQMKAAFQAKRAERLEKKFAKLDTNNDGVLSKTEFKEMKNREGRRGGRGGKFRNKR
ncbi:MAG: hypothetical protein H0T46_35445 [Deltaproteobacteria bacterium]|nr:hypothetical protein [Deltaproteobacteria bacterium]